MNDSSMNKPIRLSEHAKMQLWRRGTTEEEIVESIRTSKWFSVELDRTQCKKDYEFNSIWNNKHYETKQVNPIFVEETTEIVVITVYVFYF